MNINWFRLFAYKSGSSTLQKKKKMEAQSPRKKYCKVVNIEEKYSLFP